MGDTSYAPLTVQNLERLQHRLSYDRAEWAETEQPLDIRLEVAKGHICDFITLLKQLGDEGDQLIRESELELIGPDHVVYVGPDAIQDVIFWEFKLKYFEDLFWTMSVPCLRRFFDDALASDAPEMQWAMRSFLQAYFEDRKDERRRLAEWTHALRSRSRRLSIE
ncbi:hypothetical protein G7046_g1743 [Stylonectria norvegica]|nr:hypothetical protein G7046_g1743 [Stylonectria norvegica]